VKAHIYQFDVAKTNKTPIVGGITISTTAQSGTGIRHGLCTVKYKKGERLRKTKMSSHTDD
jgi:hypothetical protein